MRYCHRQAKQGTDIHTNDYTLEHKRIQLPSHILINSSMITSSPHKFHIIMCRFRIIAFAWAVLTITFGRADDTPCLEPGAGFSCSNYKDSLSVWRNPGSSNGTISLRPISWPQGDEIHLSFIPENATLISQHNCYAKFSSNNPGSAVVVLDSECGLGVCELNLEVHPGSPFRVEFDDCTYPPVDADSLIEATTIAPDELVDQSAKVLVLVVVASLLAAILIVFFVYLVYVHITEGQKIKALKVHSAPMSLESVQNMPPDEGFVAVNMKV